LRIILHGDDVRQAREAQSLLQAAGVEAQALAGPYRVAPDGADIVIFADAAGVERVLGEVNAPMAALLGAQLASPAPLGLDAPKPFQGIIALDAPPSLLAAQIEAHVRLALARDELARRRQTALALGLDTCFADTPKPLRILYVGGPSALYLILEQELVALNGNVVAAFSSFAGFDHLHDERFDAVVLNGAMNAPTALSLCSALRRNASLYHLPTLVITAPRDTETARAAIERGASATVEANAEPQASLGWLFEAIRRERLRYQTESALRTLRDRMGDPRTGLMQAAPFEAHLARLAADHHASGRPLSIVVLRVLPAHGANEPPEQVWRKGFTEIGSITARLLRETDTGAALGRDVVAIALPGTDCAGAKRTAERIASVAECTAFAAGDNGAAPLIFEQSVVELQPGESGAGLLTRALRAIEIESISA
jgi:two-component system, cell cycle response regulator PopA